MTFNTNFDTPQSGEFSDNTFAPTENRFGTLSFNGGFAWIWKIDPSDSYGIFETKKNRNLDITVKILDDLDTVIKQISLPTVTTKLQPSSTVTSTTYESVTIETPLMTFDSARNYRVVYYVGVHQHDNIKSQVKFDNRKGDTLTFQSNGSLVYGNDIKVSNLFDMIVVDVIKEVINSYQIMITTDSYIKKVTFNYLETLISNKIKAIDWSDKIISIDSVGFTIPNLAKRNHLKYNENDNLPNDSNSYFDVNNENLNIENTLVQLSSEMTRTYKGYNDETICLINGINSNYEWQNPQWRILELNTKNTPVNVVYSDASGSTNNNVNVPFAVFRNFEYLKDNYFNVLEEISSDAKVVNATVNITPLDLQNLRSNFIPVWIYSARFNIDGYYHVNKIENYKNNIAEVELIRL